MSSIRSLRFTLFATPSLGGKKRTKAKAGTHLEKNGPECLNVIRSIGVVGYTNTPWNQQQIYLPGCAGSAKKLKFPNHFFLRRTFVAVSLREGCLVAKMPVIVTIAGKLTLATKHVISNRMPGKSFNEHSRYRKLPVPDFYFPQLFQGPPFSPASRTTFPSKMWASQWRQIARAAAASNEKNNSVSRCFRVASKILKSENQDHQRMNAKKKDSEH